MRRFTICAVALLSGLAIFHGTVAQQPEDPSIAGAADAPAAEPADAKPLEVAGQIGPPSLERSFQAYVLLLEPDWSKVEDATEIEAELAAALGEAAAIPEDLRANLAANGPRILFAPEQVSHYSPEEFSQLVNWMRKHDLVKSVHPFPESHLESVGPMNAGVAQSETVFPTTLVAAPIEQHIAPDNASPIVRQELAWTWFLSRGHAVGRRDDGRSEFVEIRRNSELGPLPNFTVRRSLVLNGGKGEAFDSKEADTFDNSGCEFQTPPALVSCIPWFFEKHHEWLRRGQDRPAVEPVVVIADAAVELPSLGNRSPPTEKAEINAPSSVQPHTRTWSGRVYRPRILRADGTHEVITRAGILIDASGSVFWSSRPGKGYFATSVDGLERYLQEERRVSVEVEADAPPSVVAEVLDFLRVIGVSAVQSRPWPYVTDVAEGASRLAATAPADSPTSSTPPLETPQPTPMGQGSGRGGFVQPDRSLEPGFQAYVLLLEPDWSKGPETAAIEADLQAALAEVSSISDELRANLAANGPRVLFAPEHVSYYAPEDFNELVAWLRKHTLVKRILPFPESRLVNGHSVMTRIAQTELVLPATVVLPRQPQTGKEVPFVERTVDWMWLMSRGSFRGGARSEHMAIYPFTENGLPKYPLFFAIRDLATRELHAGQLDSTIVGLLDSEITGFQVPADMVGVLSWFPQKDDASLLREARLAGVEPVLVIADVKLSLAPLAEDAPADLPASVDIPNSVRPFDRLVKIQSYQPPSTGPRDPNSADTDGRLRVVEDGTVYWSPTPEASFNPVKVADLPGLIGKRPRVRLEPDQNAPMDVVVSLMRTLQELGVTAVVTRALPVVEAMPVPAPSNAEPMPGGGPPAMADEQLSVRVFTLKHTRATAIEPTLRQLFRDSLTIAADDRTNGLVVRGPDSLWDDLRDLIALVDVPGGSQTAGSDAGGGGGGGGPPGGAMPGGGMPGAGGSMGPGGAMPGAAGSMGPGGAAPATGPMPTADSLAALQSAYDAHEQRAAALAREVMELATRQQGRPRGQEEVRGELRQAVAAAFAARQELQRAELAALSQRVRQLEQTIESRDRLQERIIERRVEDLLDPAITWDPDTGARSPAPPLSPEFVAQIEGDWYLDSIVGPNILSHEQGIRVSVTPDTWTVWRGDAPARYRLVLRTDTIPNQIDLIGVFEDGRPPLVMRGIFALNDGTLRTAWTRDPTVRPSEFGGNDVGLHTYRRSAADAAADASVPLAGSTEVAGRADSLPRADPTARPELPAVPLGGGGLLIRSPEEFLRLLRDSDDAVRKAEAGYATQEELATAQKRQALIREELATQLRLLELELSDAEQAVESSTEELNRRERLLRRQAISPSELAAARQDASTARNRLDRTKALLELYLKIDLPQPADRDPSPPAGEEQKGAADPASILPPGANNDPAGAGAPRPVPIELDPAVLAAAREQSQKNLQTLALALQNYHDQHGHFPPAVILGRDGRERQAGQSNAAEGGAAPGGQPHSWRVALLPYLGELALHGEYRFGEPWDSPHNVSLLPRMPAVFRAPLDAPDSINASYFGVVWPDSVADVAAEAAPAGAPGVPDNAPGGYIADGVFVPAGSTVFSRPAGARMVEISDGTSNTIALVESRRAIPWTKPEDVIFNPAADAELPELGGWYPDGMPVSFADGRPAFLSFGNDAATIRALFTIGSGENVKLKEVD
jgi:uncharacterized protein (TIGR03067 family)